MNRRAVLAAAPAALFPASLASAMPEAETPVRRLYREWRYAYDQANAPGIDDDEVERRTVLYDQIEAKLDQEPSRSMEDLAIKIMVGLGGWARGLSSDCAPGLCAEIEALAGVKA